jgi:hypothetical protein
MLAVRLIIDGRGQGWAVVQCSTCRDVNKFPALAAFDDPVTCKCGEIMNIRDALMVEVRANSKSPRELVDATHHGRGYIFAQ